MKKATLAIAVAMMAVFSFSSCKKDDDDNNSSRSAMLVGTWKETESGEDVNSNGVWDASEKSAVASSDAVTLVFNSNGTGTISQNVSGQSITGTTTWTLINNENDVQITATVPVFGTYTFTYNIVSFTSSNIIVRDTSDTPVSYESFTKQ